MLRKFMKKLSYIWYHLFPSLVEETVSSVEDQIMNMYWTSFPPMPRVKPPAKLKNKDDVADNIINELKRLLGEK